MHLTIYKNTADQRKLDKTNNLTVVADIPNGQPTEDFNVLNPVFNVSYNAAILTANYVHVADLSRYYYITDIEILSGQRLRISCAVDVLMSYKSDILNLRVTASRSSNKFSRYLQDNQQAAMQNTQTVVKAFPNTPFNPQILTTTSSKCFCVAIGKG